MINRVFIFLLPLIALLTGETIYRGGDINSTWYWITHHGNQFFVSYILMFGIVNIFYLLPRKVYLSIYVVLVSFFSAAGVISHYKLQFRGEPLLPSDIFLSKEAVEISAYFKDIISTNEIIVALIIVLIVFIGIYFLPKEEYQKNRKSKSKYAFIALMCFLSLYMEFIPLGEYFSIRLINWDQKWNYDENGFLLGFILDTKSLYVPKPRGYSEGRIKEIIQNSPDNEVAQDFKPNIIFVQSEAFWDPTLLKGISFSRDPIPFFHQLQKTQTHGISVAPVYGGGTVNTEFEALTSFSTQFLPKGMMPFVQYVHKPMDSLASVLSKQGYQSIGVHTFDNWFYRRDKVYKDFGFERFVSSEFFNRPKYSGEFISDMELSKRVLEEINQSKKPDFVYAVSMEAHGPYDTHPKNNIQIKGNLSKESREILGTYISSISDADRSLEMLINELKKKNEPTIVVFYGDHLPMLGKDYQVYRETNYFQNDRSYDQYLKMYGVPFVIWDNFSTKKEELRLSTSFLGPYVLHLAKKEGSYLTNYLYNLYKSGTSLIVREDYWKEEKMSEDQTNDYRLLQYDLLLGNEYAYSKGNHPKINPDFQLGSNKMVVSDTNPPQIVAGKLFNPWNNKSTIGIIGNHFVEKSQIFLNGEPIKTDFSNDGYLTAIVPKDYYQTPGKLKVQVKVIDSMRNVISESNTIEISIVNK